jgi:hypothetical protein
VALKLSGDSRTSVTESVIGEPAATALSVASPGGAPATVDAPCARSSTASTRQVRGGVSVRSSITTDPPTRANRSIVRTGARPPFSARRASRSDTLNAFGPVRTTRTVGVSSVTSVMYP